MVNFRLVTPKNFIKITHMLSSALLCLTLAVHNEARGESIKGQAAVAYVVINRTKNQNQICNAVYAKGQFVAKPVKNKSSESWKKSKLISKKVLNKQIKDPTKGAKYFHNLSVSPKWKHKKVCKIGNHIFYK